MIKRLKRLKNVVSLRNKFKFLVATALAYVNDIHYSKQLLYLQNSLAYGMVISFMNSYFVIPDYHATSVLDPSSEAWFWKYVPTVKEGSVIIDIGAHIGKYSVILGKMIGSKGLVVAIEPHPLNFLFLLLNIHINNLTNIVKPYRVATWEMDNMELNLNIALESGLHSVMFKPRGTMGSIRVRTRTVDSLIHELKLNKVNLIKIDVEGAEIDVLRGAEETLKRTRYLQVEVFDQNLNEVKTMLRKYGFRKLAEIKHGGYQNIIFEKRG